MSNRTSNFAVAREGLYFESAAPEKGRYQALLSIPVTRPQGFIDYLSFATGKVTRILTLDRFAGQGFDLSPDGRTLLFCQVDSHTEDLMLIENFR